MWQMIITIATLVLLLLLPNILPKHEQVKYTDDELRQVALGRGMQPTPKNRTELLALALKLDDNISLEKIALGKELFFDKELSRDNTISCATCHKLQEGGDDNVATAIGFAKQENPSHLNTPTVLNSALAKSLFWNGRAKSLEEQAGGPIQAHFEMNMTPDEVEQRLRSNKAYTKKFASAFNSSDVNVTNFDNVRIAIASYERTLLTYGAYDRFLNGDNSAISEKAKRGFANFVNLGCKGCHTGMSVGGQSMQQFPLRYPVLDSFNVEFQPVFKIIDTTFPFENKGGFLGADNKRLFRVPILRNVTKSAPYFHNGAVKELNDVVRIMALYQLGVRLTEPEIDDIVEFLKTLEGEQIAI